MFFFLFNFFFFIWLVNFRCKTLLNFQRLSMLTNNFFILVLLNKCNYKCFVLFFWQISVCIKPWLQLRQHLRIQSSLEVALLLCFCFSLQSWILHIYSIGAPQYRNYSGIKVAPKLSHWCFCAYVIAILVFYLLTCSFFFWPPMKFKHA